MIYLFIHGGPGLNSNPEKNIIKDEFSKRGHSIYFWNEPTAKSGAVSFQDSCESLKKEIMVLSIEEKITVIAHSFGAYTLNEILPAIDEHLSQIILLSPVTNLFSLDKNLLTIGLKETTSSESTTFLSDYIKGLESSKVFDQKRFEALGVAAAGNVLLSHYWHKKELMGDYYAHFTGFEFDFEKFRTIRLSILKNTISHKTLVPTKVIYGIHDPFISQDDYPTLEISYPHSTLHLFDNSSHYGHIEEAARFYNLCLGYSVQAKLSLDLGITEYE